ncbi:methylated-DNA--[protein]-cysteine S-methyltransferase [Streptosporangiaceae bacterium NEAU-GS5]|nr:methylated-DNA--[protein]-cysteine S-methyltransferase [Streptosporangiaceae bacterium NEAU-GS5]
MIVYQVLPTPVGQLSLVERDGVLVAAGFVDPSTLIGRLGVDGVVEGEAQAARAVQDYLDGKLDALDQIPVEQPGTPRRQKLLAAMRDIPAGSPVTYGELAEMAGMPRSAARAAGGACAGNLIAPIVPCHRVLPVTGGYGGYLYGANVKEWLLRHEGYRTVV